MARAVYKQTPVEPIFATVPADLTLPQNRLVLHVPKPATAEPGQGQPAEGEEATPRNVKVTDKLYWHPDVAEGPITTSFEVRGAKPGVGMPGMQMPDLNDIVSETANREAEGSADEVPQQATGQGAYVLNTGGQAQMDGLLPPLKVTSPDMDKIDPKDAIVVKWEPVPGARGYLISGTGMNMGDDGENTTEMTTISWYSTLVQPPTRVRGGYRQETTIADDLRSGILLPGNTTSCTIPPGIFKGIMHLTLRVEAVGNDFYSHDGGITVFGTIRSVWTGSAMLMGMGDMQEE